MVPKGLHARIIGGDFYQRNELWAVTKTGCCTLLFYFAYKQVEDLQYLVGLGWSIKLVSVNVPFGSQEISETNSFCEF